METPAEISDNHRNGRTAGGTSEGENKVILGLPTEAEAVTGFEF
jgi:hypothetical protein